MRNLFSTRVKVILVVAVLLAVGLSILSGITNTTVADLAVQGVLAPFRATATTLTRTAEKYYGPGSGKRSSGKTDCGNGRRRP